MQLYWDDSAAVWTLVILYVTEELAEHESVTIFKKKKSGGGE